MRLNIKINSYTNNLNYRREIYYEKYRTRIIKALEKITKVQLESTRGICVRIQILY